jgi:hypothetical protein
MPIALGGKTLKEGRSGKLACRIGNFMRGDAVKAEVLSRVGEDPGGHKTQESYAPVQV